MPGFSPSSVLRQRSRELGPGSAGCGRLGSSPAGPAASGFSTGQVSKRLRRGTRDAVGGGRAGWGVSAPGTATRSSRARDRSSEIPSAQNPLSCDSKVLAEMQDFSLGGGPCVSGSATGLRRLSVWLRSQGIAVPGAHSSWLSVNEHPRHTTQRSSPPVFAGAKSCGAGAASVLVPGQLPSVLFRFIDDGPWKSLRSWIIL